MRTMGRLLPYSVTRVVMLQHQRNFNCDRSITNILQQTELISILLLITEIFHKVLSVPIFQLNIKVCLIMLMLIPVGLLLSILTLPQIVLLSVVLIALVVTVVVIVVVVVKKSLGVKKAQSRLRMFL